MTDYTDLARRLRDIAKTLKDHGAATAQRLDDWTPGPTPGDTHDTPGDDHDPPSTLPGGLVTDRADAARAARLHHQWTDAIADLERAARTIDRLHRAAWPEPRPAGRPDTPADAALAGWCRSCFRNDGHLEPIATRPDGTRRYRDLCRRCGEHAAAHDGHHPPLEFLRLWHTGRRVTTADYRRILGKDPAA